MKKRKGNLSEEVINKLKKYIKRYYVEEPEAINKMSSAGIAGLSVGVPVLSVSDNKFKEMREFIKKERMNPAEYLQEEVKKANKKMVDLYKETGINRSFMTRLNESNINKPLKINKETAIKFAIVLGKNKSIDEMNEFLQKTGGSVLSKSNELDLVIIFCIKERIYDINDIEQAAVDGVNKSLFFKEKD